jgi:hypothetical protein
LHPEALVAVTEIIAPGNRPGSGSLDSTIFGDFWADEKPTVPAEPDDWRAVEAGLASHADDRLRRIALAALVAQAKGPAGWTEDLRSRLAIYQTDSSTLVASAAAFTFPPQQPSHPE